MTLNKKNANKIDEQLLSGIGVHFIGIGGVSMSGIAEALHRKGYLVSGSDTASGTDNGYINRLKDLGIKVYHGHDAENVADDVKLVVKTSTVPSENPEIMEAARRGIDVIDRWQMLDCIISGYKTRIGVIGSAGKTTTTALAWHFFTQNHLPTSIVLGSVLNQAKSSVVLEDGEICIIETDESDASFAELNLNAGVFVRIEGDHLEHKKYGGSKEKLLEYFRMSIRSLVEKNAPIVYLSDCPDLAKLIKEECVDRGYQNLRSYSASDEGADFFASNVKNAGFGVTFDLNVSDGQVVTDVKLPMIGVYNVQNAIAGIAMLSLVSSIDINVHDGFYSFAGVDKRLSILGECGNFTIIDDYAHSPLKIRNLLSEFKGYCDENAFNAIYVFEPHKYSRVENLYKEYMSCLPERAFVLVMDIFGVSGYQNGNQKITTESFVADLQQNNPTCKIEYCKNSNLQSRLARETQEERYSAAEHNFILFFGAGLSSKYAKEAVVFLNK